MSLLHQDAFGQWSRLDLTSSPQDIAPARPNESIYYSIVSSSLNPHTITLTNGEQTFAILPTQNGYDSERVFSSKAGLAPQISCDVAGVSCTILVFKSYKTVNQKK